MRDLAAVGPKKGEHIEVIVRYGGKEWIALAGTVEEVGIENEFMDVTSWSDAYRREVQTGRRILRITTFDPKDVR